MRGLSGWLRSSSRKSSSTSQLQGRVVQPVEARRPAHSIGPVPERGGQRITGPRLRAAITVSVKLLIWT